MPEAFEIEKGEQPSKPAAVSRCKKFFDDSSFNAALYMFASKSWLKRILWGVALLLAIGAFGYVTITHIIRLAREPISTSITLTRENELTFPAVTICSLSLLNITTIESNFPGTVNNLQTLFSEVQDNSNIQSCMNVASTIVSDIGMNPNWGDLTYITRSDPIRSCRFVGENCINNFEPVSTVGGVCRTFNGPSSQSVRKVQGTGVRQGLRIQLSPDDQMFSLFQDFGFRVIIHNPDEYPLVQQGIAVGLNTTAYIAMRQVVSIDRTRFSSGHECRGENYDNSDQKLSFPNYRSYSPSLCLSDCFYRSVADQCQCIESDRFYTPASSPYDQFRRCELRDLCCEVDAFDAVRERCDCPPRCETVANTVTVSSSSHNDGMVGVNVFYDSLILETRETEDSYTVWSLISDIGGNTGLFLGFTLLSGVELMVLVVGLFSDCCCKKRNAQKV